MRKAVRYFCALYLAAMCLCGCAKQEEPSVYLFFTSDIEGVFWARPEPRYGNEVTGGLSVLKAFLDKQTVPFVLLEGGNWFAQTPEGTLSQGEYFNTAAATLPYAGRLFTDKDLAYGWGSLSQIIKDSPAPFILSNVTVNGKLPSGARPWLLVQAGEYRVGVFGIVSRQATEGKRRLAGLEITDEITAAREAVQTLREKGADVVVLISALGSSDDESALTDAALAREVDGIDIILSSNLGRDAAETEKINNTLIVYPGSKLDGVGRVALFFNKNEELTDVRFEDIVLYRRDFGEDRDVAEKVAAVRRAARGQMNRPAGKLEKELKGNVDEESALGDWTADCLRRWAKADAAVVNADSLRADLPAGSVTQYDLYGVYPYADHVTFLDIKGVALWRALEAGLSVPHNFAQISGLKVTYNPSAPEGNRIRSVSVGGVPLERQKAYRVAITDHMLAGGAGHDGFIDSLEFKNTQVEVRTVMRLCLSGRPRIDMPEGGRWRAVK